MNRQPDELLVEQQLVPLKLDEGPIDPGNPWSDDLLARRDIAGRLTNLVATQQLPLSVSLHGHWGTGKTFLLRRWQKDLEKSGFKAIYFNAWEDDFCDDPLLAILGQMSEAFKRGNFETLAQQLIASGLTLFKNNVQSVLSKYIGVTLDAEPQGRNLLEEYLEIRATKDELKKNLAILSLAVFEATTRPLVFIIDELDRCRPTFAIELLERVKHIFDVPHLVFVFGINRDELCKSLSSIYGEINADVYLRRFFDFEFQLQEVDSQAFAEHLIDKFQIDAAFQSLDRVLEGATPGLGYLRSSPMRDYENYRWIIPSLWSGLGLSLRDIDYGIRLLALLVRNVRPGTRAFSHPFLLSVIMALKFHKPEHYRRLISSRFRASELVDYLDDALRWDLASPDLSFILDRIEGFLYCADEANDGLIEPGEMALTELGLVAEASTDTRFLIISRRAQRADHSRLGQIQQAIGDGRRLRVNRRVFGELAALIDTYQTDVRY